MFIPSPSKTLLRIDQKTPIKLLKNHSQQSLSESPRLPEVWRRRCGSNDDPRRYRDAHHHDPQPARLRHRSGPGRDGDGAAAAPAPRRAEQLVELTVRSQEIPRYGCHPEAMNTDDT